jgi:tight adherence protein B
MLLLSVFLGILLLSFVVIAAATRPSRDDKTVRQRVGAISRNTAASSETPLEASQLLRKSASGRFGWLDQAFSHYEPMQHLRKWISQSGIDTPVSSVVVQSAIAAVVGYFIASLAVHLLLVEIAAALVLAAAPWVRVAFVRYRRLSNFEKALAHAIDMMARSLRAGHSIAASIDIVAQGSPEPAASEFAEVFRQQNFGLPLRDALLQMLDRMPSQDLRVLVTAMLVQRETGGNLVEILDRTVFVIRERQRIRGEIRTQTAQGRLTGWILTLLPVALLVLINLTDPGYSKILLTDPTGHKLLYAGLVLIGLGAFTIRQIINGIEV